MTDVQLSTLGSVIAAAEEPYLIGTVRTFTKQQAAANGTLIDAATVNWDLDTDPVATITLDVAGATRTLNFTNARAGGTYILRVIQDGTGSRTVTWNAGILWPAATDPTLTTTPAGIDVFSFVCFVDGTLHGATGGLAFG